MLKTRKCVRITEINKLEFAKEEDLCVFGKQYLVMNLMSSEMGLPIMFVFLGLSLLTNAKECYDKGAKKDAMIFVGVAIFVYVVTAYNLISKFM